MLYGLDELNESWGLEREAWAVDEGTGSKVRSVAMRGCDVLLLVNRVGRGEGGDAAVAVQSEAELEAEEAKDRAEAEAADAQQKEEEKEKAEAKAADGGQAKDEEEAASGEEAEGAEGEAEAAKGKAGEAGDANADDDGSSQGEGGGAAADDESKGEAKSAEGAAKAVSQPAAGVLALAGAASPEPPLEPPLSRPVWYPDGGPAAPDPATRDHRAPDLEDLGDEGWMIPRGHRWVGHRAMRLSHCYGLMQPSGGQFSSKPTDGPSEWVRAASPLLELELWARREVQYVLRGRAAGVATRKGELLSHEVVVTQSDFSPMVVHSVAANGDWKAPPTAARATRWTVAYGALEVEFQVKQTYDEEEEETVWQLGGVMTAHGDDQDEVTATYRGEEIDLTDLGNDKPFEFEDTMEALRDVSLTLRCPPLNLVLEVVEISPFMVGGLLHWPTHEVYEVHGEVTAMDAAADPPEVTLELESTSRRPSVLLKRRTLGGRRPQHEGEAVGDGATGRMTVRRAPSAFAFGELLEVRTHTVVLRHDPYTITLEMINEGDLSVKELLAFETAGGGGGGGAAGKRGGSSDEDDSDLFSDDDDSDDDSDEEAAAKKKAEKAEAEAKAAEEAQAAEEEAAAAKAKLEQAEGPIRSLFDVRERVERRKPLLVRGHVAGGLVGEALSLQLMNDADKLLPPQWEGVATASGLPRNGGVNVSMVGGMGGGGTGEGGRDQLRLAGPTDNGAARPLERSVDGPLHTLFVVLGGSLEAGGVMVEVVFERLDDGVAGEAAAAAVLAEAEAEAEAEAAAAAAAAAGAEADAEAAGAKEGGEGGGEGKDGDDGAADEGGAAAVANAKPKPRPGKPPVADRRVRVRGTCIGLSNNTKGKITVELETPEPPEPPAAADDGKKEEEEKKGGKKEKKDHGSKNNKKKKDVPTVQLVLGADGPFAFDVLLPPPGAGTEFGLRLAFDGLEDALAATMAEPGAKPRKAKAPKKGAKTPKLAWSVRPRAPGETLSAVDAGGSKFAFERPVPASVGCTLSLQVGPLAIALSLSPRQRKRGTGSAALVLDGDEEHALLLAGDASGAHDQVTRGFTFPQFVQPGADFRVKAVTDVPCDTIGGVHKRAGKPVPLDLTLAVVEQRLWKVKGELEGLAPNSLLILELELGHDDALESRTLSITTNGPFEFQATALNHTHYKVLVRAHPHAQTTTLTSFAGIVHGDKDVDNVRAMCTDNPWEIGGICTGLKVSEPPPLPAAAAAAAAAAADAAACLAALVNLLWHCSLARIPARPC